MNLSCSINQSWYKEILAEEGEEEYWERCVDIGDEEQDVVIPIGTVLRSQHTGKFVKTLQPISLHVNERGDTNYDNQRVGIAETTERFSLRACSSFRYGVKDDVKVDEPTEYRIIGKITPVGSRYLQFKSTEPVQNFPWPWKKKKVKKKVECWRFIPQQDIYVFGYVNEESCPTTPPWTFSETRYLCCFLRAGRFSDEEFFQFVKEFPDIETYFKKLNKMRDEYLKKTKSQ